MLHKNVPSCLGERTEESTWRVTITIGRTHISDSACAPQNDDFDLYEIAAQAYTQIVRHHVPSSLEPPRRPSDCDDDGIRAFNLPADACAHTRYVMTTFY